MDYAINVGLSFLSGLPWIVGLTAIAVVAYIIHGKVATHENCEGVHARLKGVAKWAFPVLAGITLFFSLINPVNTPKLGYDQEADKIEATRVREQVEEANVDKPIKDIQLHPKHTPDERERRFDDMANGWKN